MPECSKVTHAGYRAPDGGVRCCLCDEETEWRECDACNGDGFLDGYEEDPINFSPGEEVRCHMCNGNGCGHGLDIALGDMWGKTDATEKRASAERSRKHAAELEAEAAEMEKAQAAEVR